MCVRKKNTASLGAEDKDWYFEKATVETTIELTKYLMQKYNIPVANVIRHYDVTGKTCPNPYVYNTGIYTWDAFKKAISATGGINEDSSGQNNSVTTGSTTEKQVYRVRITWTDAGTQKGAYESLVNAKVCADKNSGYKVFDKDGKALYTLTTIAQKNTSAQTTQTTETGSITYTQKDFVKEVQSAIGANVDGIPGSETLGKTVTVSKTKNSKHAVVKPIQKRLNSLGYNCGTADGILGPKTDAALKAFQKANGCISDGELTAKKLTWQKILGMF